MYAINTIGGPIYEGSHQFNALSYFPFFLIFLSVSDTHFFLSHSHSLHPPPSFLTFSHFPSSLNHSANSHRQMSMFTRAACIVVVAVIPFTCFGANFVSHPIRLWKTHINTSNINIHSISFCSSNIFRWENRLNWRRYFNFNIHRTHRRTTRIECISLHLFWKYLCGG